MLAFVESVLKLAEIGDHSGTRSEFLLEVGKVSALIMCRRPNVSFVQLRFRYIPETAPNGR
jgi:hypothetical protein